MKITREMLEVVAVAADYTKPLIINGVCFRADGGAVATDTYCLIAVGPDPDEELVNPLAEDVVIQKGTVETVLREAVICEDGRGDPDDFTTFDCDLRVKDGVAHFILWGGQETISAPVIVSDEPYPGLTKALQVEPDEYGRPGELQVSPALFAKFWACLDRLCGDYGVHLQTTKELGPIIIRGTTGMGRPVVASIMPMMPSFVPDNTWEKTLIG